MTGASLARTLRESRATSITVQSAHPELCAASAERPISAMQQAPQLRQSTSCLAVRVTAVVPFPRSAHPQLLEHMFDLSWFDLKGLAGEHFIIKRSGCVRALRRTTLRCV